MTDFGCALYSKLSFTKSIRYDDEMTMMMTTMTIGTTTDDADNDTMIAMMITMMVYV